MLKSSGSTETGTEPGAEDMAIRPVVTAESRPSTHAKLRPDRRTRPKGVGYALAVARPSRAGLLAAQLLIGSGLAFGCQSDNPETRTATASRKAHAEDLVEALGSQPSPAALLTLLGRRHREVRGALGPHRITYTLDTELIPVEDPGRPKVGEPVLTEQRVVDELVLEWATTDDGPELFRLEQHNDADEGREVVLIDETIYTKLRHRPWFSRELDSQLHELWLDDAFHCMNDAVAFAGPALAVSVEEGDEIGGRPTLAVTLGMAEGNDATLVPSDPGSIWRHGVAFEAIEGALSLDKETGAWLTGDLRVGYVASDKLGRKLRGSLEITGKLEPVDGSNLAITAPEGVAPLPQRERYEVERVKLLDGLAAP